MNQPATLSIRPSRPSIEIDGQRQDALGGGLMSLDILESEEGFARCELVFGNWGGSGNAGFRYFGRDLLEFGKPLRVKLGDGTLFDGRISAIFAKFPEGGTPQIGVFAEDRLQDLRMTRRTRAFADASLADVLRRIAGDHGLTADVSVDGETHKVLAQVNQSDLAFIRDLARREGAQVWMDGSTLKAAPRTQRGGEAVELAWAGTLREFEVCADLAHQRTKVVAAGWSVADKRAASHEAGESAISGETSGGLAGPAILQEKFGARVDTLAHSAPLSDAEARAIAEAQFRNRARRFVTARGVAETRDTLRVGAKINIKGVGPLFEGDYVVTETHVRFEQAKGLRTEFRCDRAAIGRGMTRMQLVDLPPFEQQLNDRLPTGWGGRWYGVFAALVTDIRDPDSQGRVKVTLPWSPDAGGQRYEAWARLATMFAGNNRGSWFVPDVDDEVLVCFEHGDPRRPFVIGGLWNGRDAPPESMDGAGNNEKKVLRSRNGVKVTFDDQDGQEQLKLETPGGQTITLKDGPGAVEIVDSNGNSIKLEASGVTVTASAKVTVNASQVSVSAGMVNVDAGMSKFSGVVKADTVICNSIISASYTPGAGNIW